MKTMLAVFVLLALVGCASPTVSMQGSTQAGSAGFIVGTLADANNPVEMAVAPEYTRLIVLRKRTLLALQSGKLGAIEAGALQAMADAARKPLDAAAAAKTISNQHRTDLSAARAALLAAERRYDELTGGK